MTVILRIKTVALTTGLSRSAIYSKLKYDPKRPLAFDPTFPQPLKLGSRAIGWISEEVENWLRLQKEKSTRSLCAPSVNKGGAE